MHGISFLPENRFILGKYSSARQNAYTHTHRDTSALVFCERFIVICNPDFLTCFICGFSFVWKPGKSFIRDQNKIFTQDSFFYRALNTRTHGCHVCVWMFVFWMGALEWNKTSNIVNYPKNGYFCVIYMFSEE